MFLFSISGHCWQKLLDLFIDNSKNKKYIERNDNEREREKKLQRMSGKKKEN